MTGLNSSKVTKLLMVLQDSDFQMFVILKKFIHKMWIKRRVFFNPSLGQARGCLHTGPASSPRFQNNDWFELFKKYKILMVLQDSYFFLKKIEKNI